MRRTEAEAQQTRADIVKAALAVFSREGFAAARLEEVAKAAKVTRGAVYHHFENKESLYLAVLEDAERVGQEQINRAILEGGSYREIFHRIFVYGLALLEDDQRYRDTVVLTQEAQKIDFVRARSRNQAVGLVNAIAQYMEQGISNKYLRGDIDAHSLARAFLGFQNGIIQLWLANPEAFSIKTDAPIYAELLLRGISFVD